MASTPRRSKSPKRPCRCREVRYLNDPTTPLAGRAAGTAGKGPIVCASRAALKATPLERIDNPKKIYPSWTQPSRLPAGRPDRPPTSTTNFALSSRPEPCKDACSRKARLRRAPVNPQIVVRASSITRPMNWKLRSRPVPRSVRSAAQVHPHREFESACCRSRFPRRVGGAHRAHTRHQNELAASGSFFLRPCCISRRTDPRSSLVR